jgi:NAD(P)-dependent dehydrogenase (short-subunit alcohol dehydrogenase family)
MERTWLITGCSSGLGKGIAKAVLARGDRAALPGMRERGGG